MTIDQLRAAVRRTLRSYGIDGDELADELASIADHHAAEETAAAFSEEAADLARRCPTGSGRQDEVETLTARLARTTSNKN